MQLQYILITVILKSFLGKVYDHSDLYQTDWPYLF